MEPEPEEQLQLTDFASLLPRAQVDAIVQQWIHDDMPSFDVGGLVVGDIERQAVLWMKSPGIVAGRPFFDSVLAMDFTYLHIRIWAFSCNSASICCKFTWSFLIPIVY